MSKRNVVFGYISQWLASAKFIERLANMVDNAYNHPIYIYIEYDGMQTPFVSIDSIKVCRNKMLHMYVADASLYARNITDFKFGVLNNRNEFQLMVNDLSDFIRHGCAAELTHK